MDELKKFFCSAYAKFLVPADLEIEKLFGQASARQYFRVSVLPTAYQRMPSQTNTSTFVIMKMPQGFSSPAEEVTKIAPGAPREFPFLNVHRYLKGLELPVPEVLAVDAESGLILLEDLGNRSLENLVKDAEGEFFVFYYKKVLDLLVELQERTAAGPPKDCISAYRSFTTELLDWEFWHFLEYGIEDRFGIKLTAGVHKKFKELAASISARIAATPQGFVHRDFQSRNIMFKDYNFYMIDFQDALMGPVLYDLVGLLRDSYISFTLSDLHLLLEYFYEKLPHSHPYYGKLADLKTDFHVLTLQRKLKDTGRFQYIKTVKGNPGFLPHVPQSLSYVKEAFASLPEYDELRLLIAPYVTELK